ncbi:MAG: SRPBCC family protein [Bacteroidota bacterium]
MKKVIETTHLLNAPMEEVWAHIKTGANWENWLPLLSSSEMKGEGEGAKRVCYTQDGHALQETIVTSNDETKTFQYSIDEQEMLPMKDILGTIQLSEKAGQTQMDWKVDFELLVEEALPEVKVNIEEIYKQAAAKLDELALAKA